MTRLFVLLFFTSGFFTHDIKSIEPAADVNGKYSCAAQLTFYNPSANPISNIKIYYGSIVDEYPNPTFPFTAGASGNVTIEIIFQSGEGAIKVYDQFDNSLLTCETYQAPHISPVTFYANCTGGRYNVVITDDVHCD